MFPSITDIPVVISDNSNSVFMSTFKGDLGNFQNPAQTLHRLSTIPITRANSTVTYGRILPPVLPEVKTDLFLKHSSVNVTSSFMDFGRVLNCDS